MKKEALALPVLLLLSPLSLAQTTLEDIKKADQAGRGRKPPMMTRGERRAIINEDADIKKIDDQLRKLFPKGSSLENLYDIATPMAHQLLRDYPELASAEPNRMWEILKTALPPLLQKLSEKDKQQIEKALRPMGQKMQKGK